MLDCQKKWKLVLVLGLLAWHGAPPLAAQSRAPWKLRSSAAGAMMVSPDQLAWLAYDELGLLADVQAGYAILPWLDVQAGAAFGMFLSAPGTGGLAAPTLGALARWPSSTLTPYAMFDVGAAFTGALVLPFGRFGVGLEVPLSGSFSLGPVLSFGVVMQRDEPLLSSDAQYVSLGLACVFAPTASRPPPRKAAPARLAPRPAPVPRPVAGPSTDILQLVDRAVPGRTDQVELLAPVLFAYDSAELEEIGVAMLHEVRRELEARRDIAEIEIRAYADARGSSEYNRELAARRAQRVLEWLRDHGIDPARLKVAAIGAADFVETGSEDAQHQQNRRVVFRVLRKEEP
jgi:outer membrane protein OmpA-like peptidoglycan-associated protein